MRAFRMQRVLDLMTARVEEPLVHGAMLARARSLLRRRWTSRLAFDVTPRLVAGSEYGDVDGEECLAVTWAMRHAPGREPPMESELGAWLLSTLAPRASARRFPDLAVP